MTRSMHRLRSLLRAIIQIENRYNEGTAGCPMPQNTCLDQEHVLRKKLFWDVVARPPVVIGPTSAVKTLGEKEDAGISVDFNCPETTLEYSMRSGQRQASTNSWTPVAPELALDAITDSWNQRTCWPLAPPSLTVRTRS